MDVDTGISWEGCMQGKGPLMYQEQKSYFFWRSVKALEKAAEDQLSSGMKTRAHEFALSKLLSKLSTYNGSVEGGKEHEGLVGRL